MMYNVCIYIYIYIHICLLPTNIIPIILLDSDFPGNPAWTPYGHENSTPLNKDSDRVKPSEIHNLSREIGRTARLSRHDCPAQRSGSADTSEAPPHVGMYFCINVS